MIVVYSSSRSKLEKWLFVSQQVEMSNTSGQRLVVWWLSLLNDEYPPALNILYH